MKVSIYKLTDAGTQELAAICRLEGETVKIEGDEILAKNLTEYGIKDYGSPKPKQLYPYDGQAFLNQLQYNLKAGYLIALAPTPD